MAIELLREPLEIALQKVQSQKDDPNRQSLSLAIFAGGLDYYPPETQNLIKAISALRELDEVTHKMFSFPGISTVHGEAPISIWLLRRAYDSSVDEALMDLKTFTTATTIRMRHIVAVEGFTMTHSCEVNEGLVIIPWNLLDNSPTKQRMQLLFSEQARSPSFAITRMVDVPKIYSEVGEPSALVSADFAYDDLLNCASLFGPDRSTIIASWWEGPKWIPSMGQSYSWLSPNYRSVPKNWPDEAYYRFPELFSRFQKMSNGNRSRLHVPLSRLNSSMQTYDQVDAAIDCRIAIESLFLENDRGEYSFKISLRASRFLSTNFEERKEIFKQFNELYGLGSRAVHYGILKHEKGQLLPSELLVIGHARIAEALRKIIIEGYPDWKAIELK
jgi:hypothetical protein